MSWKQSVGINFDIDLLEIIDNERGDISRSEYVMKILYREFNKRARTKPIPAKIWLIPSDETIEFFETEYDEVSEEDVEVYVEVPKRNREIAKYLFGKVPPHREGIPHKTQYHSSTASVEIIEFNESDNDLKFIVGQNMTHALLIENYDDINKKQYTRVKNVWPVDVSSVQRDEYGLIDFKDLIVRYRYRCNDNWPAF